MRARDRCAPGSLVSHPEMAGGCLIRDFEPCLPSLDGKQDAHPVQLSGPSRSPGQLLAMSVSQCLPVADYSFVVASVGHRAPPC
jgi:hypothetical protein